MAVLGVDLVKLTGTALTTDFDGDTATDNKVIDLGGNVRFADDGPSAGASLSTGSVTHDETSGVQSAAGANDTTAAAVVALFTGVTNTSTQLAVAGYAQGSAAVIDSTSSVFGADGAAAANSKVYSLTVAAVGVDSGVQTDDGTHILLYKEGALVIGRIGSAAGAAAFAVSIDAGTGVLSMVQYSAVKHGSTSDPNDSLSVNDTALQAVVTVTDFDGDQSTASVNIGNEVKILDDGPALGFGNVIGTGTLNPQYSYWNMAPGSDTLGANGLDIALTGFHLVKPDGTVVNGTSSTFSETAPSPDGSGAYHFSGSITGDLDNNAATPDITEHFTLTAFANGTYAIDLLEGFKSTITESTANGSLGAGGPDPVQTLTIPAPNADSVVFFSVKTSATDAQILSAIGLGATDLTEAQLQTNPLPSYIDPRAMNVSTSGIGVDNNLLQGDTNAAIGGTDESFVVNPGTLVSSVKVFVDNSVQGYDYTGGERMYYKAFYADGTNSGNVLITTDLGLTNKGQPGFFTIDGGSQLIDSVQLTMAKGDVKIPEIQFITDINNLADGIKLDFTATIADKDGDTASSAFVANLSANALGSSFDFVLNGAASAFDTFNVDLSLVENDYQVNGFDVGATRDKLVLLGNVGASIAIDNSGVDSIVTVGETGGQTTTITVMGVDLITTDIVAIA
jgi:hypothetical protein